MKKLFMVMAVTIAIVAQIPVALAAEPQRRTAPLQVQASSSDVKASGEISVGPQEGTASVRIYQERSSSSASQQQEDPGNLGRGTGKASLDPNGRTQPIHETVAFKMRKALDVDDKSPAGIKFPQGKLTLEITDRKAVLLFGKRYITDPNVKQMIDSLLARLGHDYSGQSDKNNMVLEVFENSSFQHAFGKARQERGADWSKILEEYAMFVNGLSPDGKELKSEEKESIILDLLLPSNGEKVLYIEKDREVLPWWLPWVIIGTILLALIWPFLLQRLGYKPVGKELEDIKEENAKNEQRADDLADQLDEERKKNAKDIADANAAVSAAQKAMEDSNQEAQNLREQAAANAETIKNQGDTILALTTARDAAEKKADEEGRRADAAEKKVEDLERENAALKKERDEANKAAGDANAKLEQAKAQAQKDGETIRLLERDVRDLNKQVEDLRQQLADARAEVKRLERENGEKSEQLKNALERAKELQEELEMTSKELKASMEQLGKLGETLTEAQKRIEQLEGEVAQGKKDLQAALDQAKKDATAAQAAFDKQLKAITDGHAKETEALKTGHTKEVKALTDGFNSTLAERDEEIEGLNVSITTMEKNHERSQERQRQTFTELAEKQKQTSDAAIASLERRLATADEKIREMENNHNNAIAAERGKTEAVEAKLATAQSENSALEENNRTLTATNTELKAANSSLTTRVENLEDDVATKQAMLDAVGSRARSKGGAASTETPAAPAASAEGDEGDKA